MESSCLIVICSMQNVLNEFYMGVLFTAILLTLSVIVLFCNISVYLILQLYFYPWKDFKHSCCALIIEALHCFSVVCRRCCCCCCCFCCCLRQLTQEARLAVNRARRGWGVGGCCKSLSASLPPSPPPRGPISCNGPLEMQDN